MRESTAFTILGILAFIILAVGWVASVIGDAYTLLAIAALALVVVFAGGALFAHMIQRSTLDAVTKFSANDAQIDKVRMGSFRALASGESAMQRAAAQLQVIDARRVDRLAQQQSKLLVDSERAKWQAQQQQQPVEVWAWDDDSNDSGDSFQSWG